MKRKKNASNDEGMLQEYDFSRGVRGRYAKRFLEGTNIVVLEPDVAEVFTDSTSVNDALRALVRIADRKTRAS